MAALGREPGELDRPPRPGPDVAGRRALQLEHRSDDTEQVIRHRLELYQQVTQPIIGWYSRRGILVSVDAMRPAGEVGREILAALGTAVPFPGWS